jgi:glycosyltransferase involved in cell wall biosynthesis
VENASNKNIKKVCILTFHPALDARIFYKEARTLAKGGYDVVLIGLHSVEEYVDDIKIIPLIRLKSRFKRMTKTAWALFKTALKEKADVYHFHDPELIPLCLTLKLLGKKVIYDMHEYYSEVIPARNDVKFFKGFIRFVTNILLERIPFMFFDLIVFPTHSLEKEFDRPDKSLTVVNLPNIDSIKNNSDGLKWENRQYDIIHLGTVSPPRMAFMVNIAQELSKIKEDFKWVFLGISDNTINWTRANYDEEFLSRHIVMIKKVPHLEALGYVKNSRIGFNYHPPEKRFLVAIPMKVFEYMIMSEAVVTTALPELKKYLNDNIAVLIDSQNPIDYSKAIKSLLDNSVAASKMGAVARQEVIEKLNWETSEAAKLLDAYHNLLEENSKNGKKTNC